MANGAAICVAVVLHLCVLRKNVVREGSLPESVLEPVAPDSQSIGLWGATAARFLPISFKFRHTVDAEILRIRHAQNNLLPRDAEINPRHTK